MGAAQGLEMLLEALALVDDPRLIVLLAGSGTRQEQLKGRAAELGLVNVRFLGQLPQHQMTDLMATSDAAYVSLADHPLSAVTMPSKTQATLASGRAVLAAASGDLAGLVSGGGLGFVARPGDTESIAVALKAAVSAGRGELARIGEVARARYVAVVSVEHTTRRLEAVLTEVAKRPRGRWSRLRPGDEAR
jgi:glycosyltransferase involved in cell wall biosynthesis